jgi:hypothetical protein
MSNLDLAGYNRKGQLFVAANTAAKSVIAVTTSMTGVILYNPVGSQKKLLIAHAGFAYTTAPAALHNIGFALAASTATVPTSLTAIGSGVLTADGSGGSGSSVAKAYDAATLAAAPVAVRWPWGVLATGSVNPTMFSEYIDGAIAVVPGAAFCFTVVTTTAIGLGSVTWVEVPV